MATTATPARTRGLHRLAPSLWITAGAATLWLWIRVGFANYDTLYGLVWGQQLGRGETPRYSLAIAPTPHPLSNLLGLALSPLEPGTAEDVTVAIGYLALAAVAYLVYRLASEWFNRPAGLVAAALIVTREPVLSYGIRAYVDVPYVALVLAALLVETRRRRAGAPVLALLAVAGLLRPEAWLFSATYLLYIARADARARGRRGLATLRLRKGLWPLVALAASGPALWLLADGLVTGNPFWSLTKTRDTAETLRRVTGLEHVPVTGSRRLGEIMREPGIFAAALGGVLSLLWLRGRALLGAAAGVAAIVAFCVLAAAGLPIVTRYMLAPAAILAVFAGAAVFGWHELAPGDPRRRAWLAGAVAAAAALLAFAPSQAHRLDSTFDNLARQQTDRDALVALIDRGTINLRCGPVAVPNHRPVPLLALALRADPRRIVDAQVARVARGEFVAPATAQVQRDYTLDPHDPRLLVAAVPAGFAAVAMNGSWRVYERCA